MVSELHRVCIEFLCDCDDRSDIPDTLSNIHIAEQHLHQARGTATQCGVLSAMYGENEHHLRPALQFLVERLRSHGIEIPSITYMRKHFNCDWRGVAEWLDDILPGYTRLIGGITAIFDPQSIVLGGQIPTELANMIIQKTRIHERSRYGVALPGPKLIVSKIGSDASAIGAAITPFREVFY